MGTFERPDESLDDAMHRTNQIMAEAAKIAPGTQVVDLGSGYGATARYLAAEYGCTVTGINISPKENDFADQRNREDGLEHLVTIAYGDFHDLPLPDASCDVVWSQEAMLHGADKTKILSEAHRVLRPGGTLVISDLLVHGNLDAAHRQQIYDRVRSPGMWDFQQYTEAIAGVGFELVRSEHWTETVAPTYANVRAQIIDQRTTLAEHVPPEQIDKTIDALQLWVDGGNAEQVTHGFFVGTKQ